MKRTKKQFDKILEKAGLKDYRARMILFMFGQSRERMLNQARWYADTIYNRRRTGLRFAYTYEQQVNNRQLMVIAMKLAKAMRRSQKVPIPKPEEVNG